MLLPEITVCFCDFQKVKKDAGPRSQTNKKLKLTFEISGEIRSFLEVSILGIKNRFCYFEEFVLWSLLFSFLKLNTLFSSARIRLYVALVLPMGAESFALLFVGAGPFPPFVTPPPRHHFSLRNWLITSPSNNN